MSNLLDIAIEVYDDLSKKSFMLPEADSSFSLASHFADVLLDETNHQHLMIVVYGKSGTGKSFLAARLGEDIAAEEARRTGLPADYFFDIDHVSVMDSDRTREIIEKYKKRKGQILVIDETLEEAFNRDAMTKKNREGVMFSATVREYQMCIIRCIQFENFLDKGIKIQSTHEIEIARSFHKDGYNEAKVKVVGSKLPNGEYKRTYITKGHTKYHRFFIGKPSDEFLKAYHPMKTAAVDRFTERMGRDEKAEMQKEKALMIEKLCVDTWQLHLSKPELSMYACTQSMGVNRDTFMRWLYKNNKEKWTPIKKKSRRQ